MPGLGAHELEHPLPLRRGPDRGPDRAAARRPLPQGRHVEVAIERERQRARNRRGGEQQHVGRRALADQRRPLLDAEAVLLVDDDQAQPLERHALLHQRVGADHEPRLPAGEPPADRLLLGRVSRPSSSSGLSSSGASSRSSVAACCSASSSVGAISAAW